MLYVIIQLLRGFMKKISKNKKAFLILSTCILFLTSPKVKARENIDIIYNDYYEINSLVPFASYKNTNIYITKNKGIHKNNNNNINNVYIVDQRYLKDPNMIISSSSKIRDKNEMNIILDIILEYERRYPSNWNRSKESMYNEWLFHNICYDLYIQRFRTIEVDLNNEDEKVYNLAINR